MLCPYCGEKTTVSKTETGENIVSRYRKCTKNKYHRFVTIETIVYKWEAKTDENGKQK